MKKLWVLFVLFAFIGCSRLHGPRKWAVNYQVLLLSGSGTYEVTYREKSGATSQVGDLRGSWVSPTLGDYEEGTPVRITVKRTSGDCVLEVNILRSTGLHESGVLERSDTELELNDVI